MNHLATDSRPPYSGVVGSSAGSGNARKVVAHGHSPSDARKADGKGQRYRHMRDLEQGPRPSPQRQQQKPPRHQSPGSPRHQSPGSPRHQSPGSPRHQHQSPRRRQNNDGSDPVKPSRRNRDEGLPSASPPMSHASFSPLPSVSSAHQDPSDTGRPKRLLPVEPPMPKMLEVRMPPERHESRGSRSKPVTPASKGRRRALLIGINYQENPFERNPKNKVQDLNGCIDDVNMLKDLLIQRGWKSDEIRTMTDETLKCPPTKKNIIEACKWLVRGAKPGDVFFFSFSGHGAQEKDKMGYEEDGMNETILPLDWEQNGEITDDVLNKIMVRPLPSGSKLFAIIDACHSGTLLDLPYQWSDGSDQWKDETNPYFTKGDVTLISGCLDNEISADGIKGGAMTSSLLMVLKKYPNLTYEGLLTQLNLLLRTRGFWQRPMLTSSQPFSLTRPFLLEDHGIQNMNRMFGRVFRKKFSSHYWRNRICKVLLALVITMALGFGFGFGVGYIFMELMYALGLGGAVALIVAVPTVVIVHPDDFYPKLRFRFRRFMD